MNEKYTFDEVFTKDLTVVVNVINNRAITPETVIDEIEAKCGVGAVMACVPKSGTSYEVVLKERSYVGDLSDDFSIGGRSFQVKELTSRIKVVSIIHLSMYVSEEEIIDRFQKIGVEIVSEIKKRKMSSKSTVFDGTRVFRARLPPTLASIPYSMKFSVDEKDTAYYRVIHNDQRKVCSGCFSPEHIYKDCPNFKCYTCGKQGHIGRNCNAKRCYDCGHRSSACDCKKRKRYYGDGFGNPPKRHANNSDNPEKNNSEASESVNDKRRTDSEDKTCQEEGQNSEGMDEQNDNENIEVSENSGSDTNKATQDVSENGAGIQNDDKTAHYSEYGIESKRQKEQDGCDETNEECRKDEPKIVTEADECDQEEAMLEDESELSEDDDDTVKEVNENATALDGEGEKDMVTDDDLDLNTESDQIVKTENSKVKVDENVTSDRVNEIKKDKNVHSNQNNKEKENDLSENIGNSNQIENTEKSETNTDDIFSLEQSDSQVADEEMNEGACGTLDDITISDSLWVDINSQGEKVNETPGKTDTFKIVRRRGTKIVPNYKAAKVAHFLKKNKKLQ